MFRIENPILESVLSIKKLEIVHDINESYGYAKEKLGYMFEPTMIEVIKSIRGLQNNCKKETSFFSAAWLMIMTKEDDDQSDQDHAEDNKFIMAAIAWVVFEMWELKYGSRDPDKLIIFEDLFLV